MTAYVIYQGDVTDPERYEAYKRAAAESIAAAGGRYIVRGGGVEVLEGDAPAGRTVLSEFPSVEAALAWYHSPAYTEARRLREGAVVVTHMYVVEGA